MAKHKPILTLAQFIEQQKKAAYNSARVAAQQSEAAVLRAAGQIRKGWMQRYADSGREHADAIAILRKRQNIYWADTPETSKPVLQAYKDYVSAMTVTNKLRDARRKLRALIQEHRYTKVDVRSVYGIDRLCEDAMKVIRKGNCGIYSIVGPFDKMNADNGQMHVQDIGEYFHGLLELRYDDGDLAHIWYDELSETAVFRKVRQAFLSKNKDVADLVKQLAQDKETQTLLKPIVTDMVIRSGVIKEASMRVCEGLKAMPASDFLALQLSNDTLGAERYYRQSLQWLSRKDIIQGSLMARIANNVADLYPEARSMERQFVLHVGPTNSGKTYSALQAFRAAKSGVYLAPLRLLAYEVYTETNRADVICDMVTGEEVKEMPGAHHTASTVEMLDFHRTYEVAVIDEAQMLGDPERGGHWAAALMGVRAKEVHICCAPEGETLVKELIDLCGDTYICEQHERSVPLIVSESVFTYPESIQPGDALVTFSKRQVLELGAHLQKQGKSVSVIYGALPYEVRQSEVRRFVAGETEVLVCTDAIGMGLNLPVKRIVFMQIEKFDGYGKRNLNASEIKQIAGRAGRMGIFNHGEYVGVSPRITAMLNSAIAATVPPVQETTIPFPEFLTELDMPVSEVVQHWNRIDTATPHISTMQVSEELCQYLEHLSQDKRFIYQFLTLPFDENDDHCRNVWRQCAALEANETGSVAAYIQKHLSEMPTSANSELKELELAYKICDILYSYCRKFHYNEHLQSITDKRSAICKAITTKLQEQPLPSPACRICSRPLPFFHPYRICNKCYHSSRYVEW